jgi:hypothetical protein
VKGLEGVDQRLLDKLEGAGVQSVSDLATSTASELLEEYYSSYDDSGIGITSSNSAIVDMVLSTMFL